MSDTGEFLDMPKSDSSIEDKEDVLGKLDVLAFLAGLTEKLRAVDDSICELGEYIYAYHPEIRQAGFDQLDDDTKEKLIDILDAHTKTSI